MTAQLIAALLSVACVHGAAPHRVTVDFSSTQGTLRPLHGINKGPLAPNGLVDLTEAHRRLRVPSTRLHDCHHPNPAVVDLHAVFPDPDADPSLPASYEFRATDEYLAAVRATGAEIIYRLGESIEHQTVKRHVHPPRDPARWAAACAGIVRHYNEGWAGGYRYGIRYWEIWNEPENRPVMWTGTDAQFLEVCNFYHGETGGFGLFTEVGAPTRNYHALLAFAQMLDTPQRGRVTGAVPGTLSVVAGTHADSRRAAVLIAHRADEPEIRLSLTGLPWKGASAVEVRLVDAARALEPLPGSTLASSELTLKLPPPCVALVTLRPQAAR